MMRTVMIRSAIFACLAFATTIAHTRPSALGTAFTYQGLLKQSGTALTGTADFQFTLWDALAGGTQVAGPVASNNVAIADGEFTTQIDFGALAFNGDARRLQIAVRSRAGGGSFTTLSPRQPLTATPYALQTRGLFVDANRRVGMGTTTPNENLTVAGSMEIGTSAGDYEHLRIGGGNSSGFLYGSFPAFADGIHLGYNYYANNAGANVIPNAGGGTSRLTMGYGFIKLATGQVNFPPFDIMTISGTITSFNSGFVGIGTTTPNTPLYVRTFNGAFTALTGETTSGSGIGVYGLASSTGGNCSGVYGQSNSASGWDFWAGGAGVNYGAPSSVRWKRNIELIRDPLDGVELIRGVTFDWDAEHGGQHDVGFIGEEVGKVLPEVVVYEPDSQFVTGMDYSKVTPLLVEAIKALRAEKDAEIHQLNAQNQALQESQRALETRVEMLEAAIVRLTGAP